MLNPFRRYLLLTSAVVGAICIGAVCAEAAGFKQVKLVSDIKNLAAVTDSNLKNPWGVSHSATSPFWVSNQGTNTSTIYAVTDKTTVSKLGLTVAIPTTSSGPQGPTGQVNNSNAASFLVGGMGGDGKAAVFIFADLNGTISAWDPGAGTTAIVQVTTKGAIYTGLTINGAQTQLYAVDNASGSIDVFDSTWRPVTLKPGAFVDPRLPKGLRAFNARDILGDIYVTYAPIGRAAQTMAPLGAGAVAVFTEDGTFIKQLIAHGRLAAPWGIALAPAGFGELGSALLVGNFSYLHSEINAFDPTDGKFVESIQINNGGHGSGGLWTLDFGVGGNNGDPNVLYFTDGINREKDGLFGAIVSK
jgi:uncharacterized protein (TIGR03118 family)